MPIYSRKAVWGLTSILTGNLSSGKVMADSNVGGMGETKGSSSNAMRSSISVGSIDTSIKELSISITLSVVSNTIDTGIASIARNRDIEGIDTWGTLQSNKLSISISLAIVSNSINASSISSIAGYGNIEGIDAGSTLQANTTVDHLGICKGNSNNSREDYKSIHFCRG